MNRLKILTVMVVLASLFGCGTTKFAVKRMAPARYDIAGIKRVGVLDFGTEYSGFANGAAILTSTVESKLIQSGFFQVAPRINKYQGAPFRATPAVFPELLAKVGKEAGVDLMIFGVVEKYDSRTEHDTKKEEEEVSTGRYRTEAYVENGVKKTRQVEVKQKKVTYVPTAMREAKISFYGYALRTDSAKYAGKDLYEKDVVKNAEGDSEIRALPSEQRMLSEITDQLGDIFIANVTPHEVTEYIKLKNDKCCKDGIKLAKSGDWDGALDSFRAAVAADPGDHVARYDLGVAYEHQKDLDQARECYREAMRLSNKPLYNEAWVRVHDIMQQDQRLQKQLKGR